MKTVKKIGSIIINVLLWIIILLAALFAFVTLATKDQNNISSIGGISPLTVESDSMKPTFSKGDLILIKKCDPEDLEVGDIITFHTIINNESALNTHRIVEIQDENGFRQYVTQGDNNDISDELVIADGDIVGKYIGRVPKMGYVMSFLSGKVGFLCVIVIPMLLFFLYQIYHLIMIIIEMKKATALEAAEAALKAEKAKAEASEEEKDAATLKAEAEAAMQKALQMQAEAEARMKEAENAKAAAEGSEPEQKEQ